MLVNNAGILGNITIPMEQRATEEFNRVIAVYLLGQFIGVKTIVRYMRKNGVGSIINMSSFAGISGLLFGTAYTASKGGSKLTARN